MVPDTLRAAFPFEYMCNWWGRVHQTAKQAKSWVLTFLYFSHFGGKAAPINNTTMTNSGTRTRP
jgi:nitrate/nitrite transporter NarK